MIMTLPDITKTFQADLPDEVNDANAYLDMAMAAKEMHQMELAEGLAMMAKDEYTHAKFIHKWLKETGVEIPEQQKQAYMKMEERIMAKFHR